jgi:hypothetical protein
VRGTGHKGKAWGAWRALRARLTQLPSLCLLPSQSLSDLELSVRLDGGSPWYADRRARVPHGRAVAVKVGHLPCNCVRLVLSSRGSRHVAVFSVRLYGVPVDSVESELGEGLSEILVNRNERILFPPPRPQPSLLGPSASAISMLLPPPALPQPPPTSASRGSHPGRAANEAAAAAEAAAGDSQPESIDYE